MVEATRKRERTCIGCGAKAGKAQLHRIVRTSDGSVCFDESGKLAGRGAYVCSSKCLENALKASKLQRALRVSLDGVTAERICRDIEQEGIKKTSA